MAGSPIQIDSQLPDDLDPVDHLSNLPDDLIVNILSLFSTRAAARTSLLSRRFRHLWESSPTLHISNIPSDKFAAMVDCVLLRRNPVKRLFSLYLSVVCLSESDQSLRTSLISSCLVKARQLGVRHLTIHDNITALDVEPILPIIFSIDSLESLYLLTFRLSNPSGAALTCLKSLHFFAVHINSAKLNQLLAELPCLEDLHLEFMIKHVASLSSQTIRKLKLTRNPRFFHLELCIPSLELLHYESHRIPCIHGEIPSLRKVVFIFDHVGETAVNAFAGLLEYISHVEELTLQIKENTCKMYPFPILLEPGKNAPTFSRLKHLDVTACFHNFNLEAIIAFLHHSPSLESVRLFHKTPHWSTFGFGATKRNKKYWASKLPRNAHSNRFYAHFTNLHLAKNSEEFMKLLNKKCTPKRQRMKFQSKKSRFLKNRDSWRIS